MDDRRGLRGSVRTKDGWAVRHAIVTVTDLAGRQVAREQTGEDGVLAAGPLPAGTYTVIVTAMGFQPTASTLIVHASGAADLGTLVLARAGGTELPPPGPWTIDPAHSNVGAVAQHLGLSSVRGRFAAFEGSIEITEPVEASRVTARIEAASIDTGNKLRDDHLRSADFMNVDEHPVISYEGEGLTATGPDGAVTTRTYTLRGELATQRTGSDGTVSYTYNGDGTVASVTDALGDTTSYTYDARGNRTARTDAQGKSQTWGYDDADELVSQADQLNRTTATTYYDDTTHGHKTTLSDPSGRVTTTSYNPDGTGQGETGCGHRRPPGSASPAGRRPRRHRAAEACPATRGRVQRTARCRGAAGRRRVVVCSPTWFRTACMGADCMGAADIGAGSAGDDCVLANRARPPRSTCTSLAPGRPTTQLLVPLIDLARCLSGASRWDTSR